MREGIEVKGRRVSKTSREEVTRPLCAICGGEIPTSVLSDRDVLAERSYSRERRVKGRDFYCGMPCFRVARTAVTSSPEARSAASKRSAATRKARGKVKPDAA